MQLSAISGDSINDLRAEFERLRQEVLQRNEIQPPIGEHLSKRFGIDLPVIATAAKLHVGGLVQVWYQSILNDNVGLETRRRIIEAGRVDSAVESNEVNDNDTLRVRRVELRFTIDIHENVSAHVMIDPARAHNANFYPLPTFGRHNRPFGDPFLAQTGSGNSLQGAGGETGGFQFFDEEGTQFIFLDSSTGGGILPSLLQDAFIHFRGIPHHEFFVGQVKPPTGEEAWRSSGNLDFVERAMVTSINNVRDIGVMVHGNWLEDRVRYWFGLFNGPTGTVLSDPELTEGGNRSDDNDEKDFAWRIALRPMWNPEKWHGRLEIGYSQTIGVHGESGQEFSVNQSLSRVHNAINSERTPIRRRGAWASYRPGGPVRGWWLRGEWANGHDRFGRNNFTSLLGIGTDTNFKRTPRTQSFFFNQKNPTPVTAEGWYFATGYRVGDSVFAEKLTGDDALERSFRNLEFTFRYETYENVATEDLARPDRHTDLFKTQVWTAGINYYLQKHDAKIQANYMWVDEPESPRRGFREVRNDVFVLNFQVAF